MQFKKLAPQEQKSLHEALRRNAEADTPLRMNRLDTTFIDSGTEPTDDEVISIIRSVPCHY